MKREPVRLRQVPRIREHLRTNPRPHSADELGRALGVHPDHIARVLKMHLPEDIMPVPAGVKGYDTQESLWIHTDHKDKIPVPKNNYRFKLLNALRTPATMDQIQKRVACDTVIKNEFLRFIDEGVAEAVHGEVGRRGTRYMLTSYGQALTKEQEGSKYLTPGVLGLLTPHKEAGISKSDRAGVNSLISLVNAGREYYAIKERGAQRGEIRDLSKKYGFDPKVFNKRVTFKESPLGRLTREGAEYRLWLVRERDPYAEWWIRDAMARAGVKLKPAKGQARRRYGNKLDRRREMWFRRHYTSLIPELRLPGVSARTSITNQLGAYIREAEEGALKAATPHEAERLRFAAGVLRKMRAEQRG